MRVHVIGRDAGARTVREWSARERLESSALECGISRIALLAFSPHIHASESTRNVRGSDGKECERNEGDRMRGNSSLSNSACACKGVRRKAMH